MFSFSEAVLKRKRVLIRTTPHGEYYASACPLVHNKVLGELQTETKVHGFTIDGVKKFQVDTYATFNLCNADDPFVLTMWFLRTGTELDMSIPLTPSRVESNKPKQNPRIKITPRGARRIVTVSGELPQPTNLKVKQNIIFRDASGTYYVQSFYSVVETYSSENPPTKLSAIVYEGTYQNPKYPGVYNLKVDLVLVSSGETITFESSNGVTEPNLIPLSLNTPYVVEVRAENATDVSPYSYYEYQTPGISNLIVRNEVELPSNLVLATFSFDYTPVDPGIEEYYNVTIYEGTFKEPTNPGNYNLQTVKTFLRGINVFKSLAEEHTTYDGMVMTPLKQGTQYVAIVSGQNIFDQTYCEFITEVYYGVT
jgi:hypothetical protein